MKIHEGLNNISEISNTVITIGTFDGVHLGHQKIIDILKSIAQEKKIETAIFTFYPHPRKIVKSDDNKKIKLIFSQFEKKEKLRKLGINHLIIQPFTEEFSNITASDFIENILVKKLKVKTIVVGYDHQFGKNREGNIDFLREKAKKFDFEVIEIPAQVINENNVSSSKIRIALEQGFVHEAKSFLGEAYSITGRVVEGKKLGRTIGFPTANVCVEDEEKIIPQNGVYICEAIVEEEKYKAMVNIGTAPTTDNDQITKIEAHILDFNLNIYGKKVTLKFYNKIRDEQKFDSLDSLIQQLKNDQISTINYFNTVI